MNSIPPTTESLLQHREFLRALARQLLGDEHLAEDVVQDSLIAALTQPPRSREALRSWLAQVVTRRASNRKRTEARRRRREREVAHAESLPSSHEVSESLHAQRRVLAALDALSEPYRTTIYLRWYEGLPPREIAERMNVPVETVRSRVQRGLARLRGDLDQEFGAREHWALLLLPLTQREGGGLSALPWIALVSGIIGVCGALAWHLQAPANIPDDLRPPGPIAMSTRGRSNDTGGVPDLRQELAGAVSAASTAGGNQDADPTRSSLQYESHANVPNGPRFELELDLPPGVKIDDLRAELMTLHEPLPNRATRSFTSLGKVPVRPGRLPWVAFSPLPPLSLMSSGGRDVHVLRVVTGDSQYGSSVRVHAVNSAVSVAVGLRLDSLGELHIRVRDERGLAIAGAAVLVAGEGEGALEATYTCDELGRVLISGLSPGEFRLDGFSRRHASASLGSLVVPGSARVVDLCLERLPEFHVAGRLRSRSGDPLLTGPLRLSSTSNPKREFVVIPTSDPAFPGTLLFDFGLVPEDEYILLPPLDSPFLWEPRLRRISSTSSSASMECLDGGVLHQVLVRASDSESGEPILSCRATLLINRYGLETRIAAGLERGLEPRDVRYGESPWNPVALDVPLHWLVECEGYMAVQGSREDLVREGGDWVIDVRLSPSWRASFWMGTFDDQGDPVPVEGVALLTAGDRELGRSLADGFIHIELSYDPGRLHVQLEGLGVREWEGFTRGKRSSIMDVHRIWLETR